MAIMLNELVDLARLQADQALELRREPTDLVTLVQQCVEDQRLVAPTRDIRFEIRPPALVGEWDPARLSRVVANLLGNAVKYSPESGAIQVELAREGPAADREACAVLIVRDHGIGIPAAELPHIFDRFWRGTKVADQIAGTGLGLAIVQRIVEQHDGAITVESREGHGSTFEVRLPLTPPRSAVLDEFRRRVT